MDARLGVFVGDGGESCAQVGIRVDGVQFAGFDQGCHASTGAAALVMPGEERVLAIQGGRPDGVFDRVGVHLDAAIRQEYLEAVPVAVEIAKLFTQSGFGGGREDQETIRGIVFPNDAALMGQPVAASLRSSERIVPGG